MACVAFYKTGGDGGRRRNLALAFLVLASSALAVLVLASSALAVLGEY